MKFTEEQRHAIIEAVYNHVGDEYDKDEHGNAALKLDSQDIKFLNCLESILSPLPHQDGASAEDVLKRYEIHASDVMGFVDTEYWITHNDALLAMSEFAQLETSSIGEDEIQKAAIECLEASTDLTETEQVFVLAGFYEGAKYAIPRLSDRKIVLPSEINGFDYCSSSECVNAFESGYDLAISEIKRLNGIN